MTEPRDFQQELVVREPLLDQQLAEQAAQNAYWGTCWAQAMLLARQAKLRATVVTEQVRVRARATCAAQNIRDTEANVNMLTVSDPDYFRVWEEYNQAQHTADMMDIAKTSFSQRKDALVTIAANLREQMKGHPRVYNQQ